MHAALAPDPYDQGLAHLKAGRRLEAVESFERALALRPSDSHVLFALGNTARALGMVGPAEEFYRRVLALEPERLEAIVNLANLLRTSGNFEGARAILEAALGRNPVSPELHLTLGSVHREAGALDLAETSYRAALAKRPDYAAALCNLGDILADTGDGNEALVLYDRAIARDPASAQVRLNRAVLHLLRGELEQGWRDYAARLKLPNKVPAPTHGLRAWDGGSLKRTRLLVTAEQGVGDQIMFASVIGDLTVRAVCEGGQIILECEPRLQALFARSFPKAVVRPWVVETRADITTARHDWLNAIGGANAAIAMGSLPRMFRKIRASFPDPHAYLVPDEAEKRCWRDALTAQGAAPFVGICWRSGSMSGHRVLQYAPLRAWADFLRDIDGSIVCAQYDAKPEEVAALEEMSGRTIFVPPGLDQKNELDRTAALMAALDGVISAPTAVSWLSAGVGTPTLKVLYDTSWTALGEGFEPFAPACRCIQPESRGNWDSAFARVREALRP